MVTVEGFRVGLVKRDYTRNIYLYAIIHTLSETESGFLTLYRNELVGCIVDKGYKEQVNLLKLARTKTIVILKITDDYRKALFKQQQTDFLATHHVSRFK